MITLVFLKALCDLGIYYTFAGFFAVLLGAAPALLLAALPLQALCFAAAFPLRRGRLRYLPLAALLLCWLLPGVGLMEAVTFLPPAAYLVWLTVKGRFFPEWSHQVDIFSRFWKLLFPFLLLALVFGGAGALTAITIPAGSVTLLCSVLLNRTLRHDPEVYCQRRCQLLNLAVVALAGLCALLLSTPAFLRGCLACLRALYTYLITPILMLLVYAAVGLLSAVMWLLSRISLGAQGQENAVELDLQSAAETLGLQEAAGDLPAYLEQAALAIAILAAILILGAVFRYLARRSAGAPPAREGGERREALSLRRSAESGEPESPYVQRVRAQYRRFLKLYHRAGFPRSPGDTSGDIARCSRETLGEEVLPLRELYIGARYGGEATREDAARAKELCARLKHRQSQREST